MMEHKLIYLASPYSHSEESIREDRFRAACHASGGMMRVGYRVFSPIAHTHPIAVRCDLPKGWDFWQEYDRVMIEASSHLIVLMIDGWMDSKGVDAERRIAESLDMPVYFGRFCEVYSGADPRSYTFA